MPSLQRKELIGGVISRKLRSNAAHKSYQSRSPDRMSPRMLFEKALKRLPIYTESIVKLGERLSTELFDLVGTTVVLNKAISRKVYK
ncbi:MAG: hypothetical protein K1X49_01220 [Saprospiraceae bacterium]|nr:hypothetical protein [Saprospiraceae bacterium]